MPVNLKKLCVMVTRPKPDGEKLCEEINKLGGKTIYFPTIQVSSLADSPVFQQQIKQLSHFDWIIFVSPQAVYHSMTAIKKYWPQFPLIKVAAVGAVTAHLLTQNHIPVTLYPLKEWSSEGLLKLDQLQQLSGQRVAIIQGKSGRNKLAEVCAARGAEVMRCIAYQRDVPIYADVSAYLEQTIHAIICTSGEGLENLVKLAGPPRQSRLMTVPLVVSSERLLILAEHLHFKKVFLAENAGSQAILDALAKICLVLKELKE